MNLWDARAEGLFKEIRDAYRVSGDPTARPLYDRLGHQAFEPARDRPARPGTRGEDIHYAMELELGQALRGVRAEIEFTRLEPCEAARRPGGAAARRLSVPGVPGTSRPRRPPPGSAVAARCGVCGGTGWRLPPPCPGCGGRGTRARPGGSR